MIVQRAKSKFKSARAAWADIARVRGLSPRTHRLRRIDTATSYRWKVTPRNARK